MAREGSGGGDTADRTGATAGETEFRQDAVRSEVGDEMLDRMTVWFTSDLHFGHANIITYSDRPFADVEEMNRGLIERWNSMVHSDDTVWVLGDVAMGRIDETLAHVTELNGRKILVAGNHDRCWMGHGERSTRWIDRYRAVGFDEIHQGEIDLQVGDLTVHACHFPYRGDSHDHDRFVDERPADDGNWLLHGHVHERWRQRDRMINVGVDVWDYFPVAESTIAALIADGPNDIARGAVDSGANAATR